MEFDSQKISGRLLRAARVLAGVGQKSLVHEIDISMSTLKCLERQGVKVAPHITRPSAARLLEFFDKRGVRFAKHGGNYCGVYLDLNAKATIPTMKAANRMRK